MRVLKLFGDQRPDLCGWRVAPCDGYRPTDDMKLGPFARLPREHHQAHQKQIAALPTQSVEAQKREKKRMRRKGKRRGRSKTPPPQPEAPPVDFCYREFPPAPRRGHILALHVPGRRSGTFTKPVVLCFGGALLGAGRGRVCEPDLSIYDPEAASDAAIERARARHAKALPPAQILVSETPCLQLKSRHSSTDSNVRSEKGRNVTTMYYVYTPHT